MRSDAHLGYSYREIVMRKPSIFSNAEANQILMIQLTLRHNSMVAFDVYNLDQRSWPKDTTLTRC